MKCLSSFFFLLWLCISVNAQSNYAVSAIPKNLLSKAGAIVRNSETSIEVKELDDVYYRTKYAITILNASALADANLYLGYDKTTTIKSVKAIIYNELGIPMVKVAEKNFQDRSSVSDMSLYEDSRVKYYVPTKIPYPYTIEYEYEIKSRQSLYFPSWVPGGSTGVAIESSSLKFTCPKDFVLRHKESNYNGKVEEETREEIKTYKWEVNGIKALRDEPYSPYYEKYLVTVRLAPENFAFKNMKGSFTNWHEYGTWTNNTLLKDRDAVSETTKLYILSLVKDVADPKEKARKIYEYVQNKTRYISVQIGIGGYQPYAALDVDRLGYGDCKGLVNYMRALLKIADVESYYTVVYAGTFKVDISPDFASMQGNHVILCLPFKNDTTWLECTSKFAPFGFLGDFTDDRYVVACTPDGGKIMRTPKLGATDNNQIRKADFKIDSSGSISGSMKTSFSGSQYDNHHTLLNEAYSEQLKKLPELYPLPNLKIESLKFELDKGDIPKTQETISLKSYNYCRIADSKLYVRLNGINKMRPLREVSNRANPVHITRGFYDEDTFTYELPDGYKIILPPNKKEIKNPFGYYTAEASLNGRVITYKRKMLLNEGNYSAEEYQNLVDFFQSIADADGIEAVFTKL